jgi:hypothetical protein
MLPEVVSTRMSLSVSDASFAGARTRADGQDAPRRRRRVGPRLRLSDRRPRPGARPASPHPDGHHSEHEYRDRQREHQGQ